MTKTPLPNNPDAGIDWLTDAPLTSEQRHAWNAMRTELIASRARIGEMEKKIKLLEQPAPDDPQAILTRPEFNREVARMLAFDERYGGISSVLYFDFENLDAIGTRHGKSVANASIREISTALMRHVRGSDVVGRLAADEFGVLLVRCDNDAAWKKAEQLSAALFEILEEVHGCKLNMEISYGAYTFREKEDVATGLKEAAQMVTKAKAAS
jgi:diguanylate cyclase (GGDEF)-like protein